MKRIATIALSLSSLALLSACGGGGGGSTAASAATPTSVSGTAAKGLVKQARVLVCRIVSGAPEADASCATGITGSDGSFTVAMADGYTGPAMIKIVAGTASMMADETTGTDLPYSMIMRAVVPAVSAGTTVYVTPFSDMAAAAVGLSAIDAGKITLAMTTVQTLMMGLGIDLTVKPMVDLRNNGTDAVMLGRQANMVQQLTRVMLAARAASALKDGNGVACNAAGSTAAQQVACAIGAMAGLMTGAGTSDTAKAATVLAALMAQNVTTAYLPILRSDGTLDMEPADMSSSASLQAAMQRAGMSVPAAANAVGIMMPGMMH